MKLALFLVPSIICFVVALIYHLRVFNTRIVLIFDSAHYLLTATQITAIARTFLAGHGKEAVALAHAPDFVRNIMIDGPILPTFGALTFLLSGQPAAATSWPVLVAAIALFAALTAGCVGVVTRTLTRSYAFAYGAALLYALYPSTIVSAGRFLTEPLATLNLILLAMASAQLLIAKKRTAIILSGVATGILIAVGFLTKAALLPAWLFLPGLAIVMRYRHLSSREASSLLRPLTAIALGVALILCAWLSFTSFATGKMELMPQRMPAFNLATGNNPETDGRATMPAHPLTLRYGDMGKSTQIVGSAWVEHGNELANLYMRKIPRVMGFVWNDFKQVVLGVNVDVQNCLHGTVLTLSLIGLFWFLIALGTKPSNLASAVNASGEISDERRYWMLASGGLIVIHTLLYLPFESIVRYGAPVIPFVIIAAAAGARWLNDQKPAHKAAGLALVLLSVAVIKLNPAAGFLLDLPFTVVLYLLAFVRSAMLFLLFLFVLYLGWHDVLFSERSSASKRLIVALAGVMFAGLVLAPVVVTTLHADGQREYAVQLQARARLSRSIALPALPASGTSEFLAYIDCDNRYEDATVRVNGTPVSARLTAANKLDSQRYFLFTIMRMYASIFDMPTDYLRQWRVVQIPSALIKPGQANTLEIEAGPRGLTVFGDRFAVGEKTIHLPDRKFYSANRFCNDGREFETRVLDGQPVATASDMDALRSGRQPRLYLLEARPVEATSNKIGDGAILFDADLPLKSFDPVLSLAEAGKALKIDRYTLQLARSTSMGTSLPESLANEEQIEILLRGKITSRGRADKAGVFATLHGSKATTPFMILSASPPFVKAGPEWRDFSIDDRIFLRDFTAGHDRLMLSVGLFPGRWEQFSQYGVDHNVGSFLIKDLHLTVRRLPQSLDLAKCKLQLY